MVVLPSLSLTMSSFKLCSLLSATLTSFGSQPPLAPSMSLPSSGVSRTFQWHFQSLPVAFLEPSSGVSRTFPSGVSMASAVVENWLRLKHLYCDTGAMHGCGGHAGVPSGTGWEAALAAGLEACAAPLLLWTPAAGARHMWPGLHVLSTLSPRGAWVQRALASVVGSVAVPNLI